MGNCCIIKLTRIIQIGDLYNPGWDKNKNVQSLMLKFVSSLIQVPSNKMQYYYAADQSVAGI
jgi:hypothetical protein